MQRKIISESEYLKVVHPDGKLTFSVESPFSRITRPNNSFVMACHGNPFIKGFVDDIQTGTAYAIGISVMAKAPIKIYAWQVIPREGGLSFELREHEKEALGYHHAWKLPQFIENEAPVWVNDKVREHLENFVL